MKFKNSILLALIVFLTSAFTIKNYLIKDEVPVKMETSTAKTWTDLETAIKLSKQDQKKILVDIYTDWCKWCKVMDAKTFSDPKVATFLSENFHLAKFNAEQKEAINFQGKEYTYIKNGRRGYHGFAADALDGRLGYPSLVVYDSNLNKLEVIRGYKSADELLKILNYPSDS